MLLTTLLVSELICPVTVAALINLLESRDGILITFTHKVHVLYFTIVSCTDRLVTGVARTLHPT
jgi:hypothetical protein